jgi:hypothetical protein
MKYLKYFENLENNQLEIKKNQEWISKDGKISCKIINVNPSSKDENITVKISGIKEDIPNSFISGFTTVNKEYILNDFNLIDNNIINNVNLDFYKTTYVPEDKSVIGAYFITEKTNTTIKILNLKEHKDQKSVFYDNATPYTISVYYATLPTTKVQILFEDEYRKGFFYLKIPYWLFKNESDNLEIKRISQPLKRFSYKSADLKYKDLIDAINNEHIFNYIKYSNFDKKSYNNLKSYANNIEIRKSSQ